MGDPNRVLRTSGAVLLTCLVLGALGARADIPLPGTQPGDLEFAKVEQCKNCHGGTPNGDADPFASWQGGMMSQAARDPVFRAALAIANQDVEGSGEYCLRCHTPRGWISGRSTPSDGSKLNREDLHGVSCDVCHRLVDPLSSEGRRYLRKLPPGRGNAMMVMDPGNVVRGPYEAVEGAMPHEMKQSAFQHSSELCATCHNVSNPLQAEDVTTQPPYAYGHIERTYSEWLLSDYQSMGQTCQSCHFPAVPDGGQSSRYGSLQRDYFVEHGAVGGSTWVQDAVVFLWKKRKVGGKRDINVKALARGKKRAEALLKSAAKLELTRPDARVRLRVINLSGHKLPTGYPEGRRMWVNIRFRDAEGGLLAERGQYGNVERKLGPQAVTVPTLIDPEATRVYECLPGLSEAQAKRYAKKPGKSFHFVLNDITVKDNRIPPRGFINELFAKHKASPVGANYANGQHWDDVFFDVPPGTASVEARLFYQSVSFEYLKFLVEENRTDTWSTDLYQAWTQTGKCPPTEMGVVTLELEE